MGAEKLEKPYTIRRYSSFINGPIFGVSALRDGLIVGGRVGLKLLETEETLLVIQFIPNIEDLPEAERFDEQLKFGRRYHYSQPDGVEIFLKGLAARVSRTGNDVRLQMSANQMTFRKAAELGIQW